MTREQAFQLKCGEIIHETEGYNRDGTCRRWRVNGKLQAYKRNPDNFRLPLKHGLVAYGYLTKWNLVQMHTEDECENPHGLGR